MVSRFEINGGQRSAETGPMVGGPAEVAQPCLIEAHRIVERGHGGADAFTLCQRLGGSVRFGTSRFEQQNAQIGVEQFHCHGDASGASADDAHVGLVRAAGIECASVGQHFDSADSEQNSAITAAALASDAARIHPSTVIVSLVSKSVLTRAAARSSGSPS